MDLQDLISSTTDLLEVASDCWLNERNSALALQANEQDLLEARCRRRAELTRLSSRLSQLAEVDARIVLIDVANAFPERERFLLQLLALRKRLVKETKNIKIS